MSNIKTSANDEQLQKKLNPEWTCQLGQEASDIVLSGEQIFVLLENSLATVSNVGVITGWRAVEEPVCAVTLGNTIALVVGSNHLLFLKDNELKWMCKSSFVPVHVRTIDAQICKGMLALISEKGELLIA